MALSDGPGSLLYSSKRAVVVHLKTPHRYHVDTLVVKKKMLHVVVF
jgi:hypothetical protein